MPRHRTLEEMVADAGYSDEVGNAVISDVDANKTRERIESGELALPHPGDAANWHARVTGKMPQSATDERNQRTIDDLNRRIAALEDQKGRGES